MSNKGNHLEFSAFMDTLVKVTADNAALRAFAQEILESHHPILTNNTTIREVGAAALKHHLWTIKDHCIVMTPLLTGERQA